jgi:hypothetical protein
MFQKLEDPMGLSKDWFSCLSYSPLYARPVILEMIREWSHHVIHKHKNQNWDDFLSCFDQIFKSQILMVLEARNLPAIRRPDDKSHFGEIALLGQTAIYTLNLIILRTILEGDEYCFDEEFYTQDATISEVNPKLVDTELQGTRPWDRLIYLWRSWFTLDNLNGLSAILKARREENKIFLKSYDSFQARSSNNRLETVRNVAFALGDDITFGLSSLHTSYSDNSDLDRFEAIKKRLESEKIDLSFEFLLRRFRFYLIGSNRAGMNVDIFVQEGLRKVFKERQAAHLVVEFFELLGLSLRCGYLTLNLEYDLFRELFHSYRFMDFSRYHPLVFLQSIQIAREFGGVRWSKIFVGEFIDNTMNSKEMMRMIELDPDIAIEWLRFAREYGSIIHWNERFGERLLDRFFHSKDIFQMLDLRPEIINELLRLVREYGDTEFGKRIQNEFIDKLLHSKEMMRLIEIRPDVAVECLRLTRDFGDKEWSEKYIADIFHHIFQKKNIRRLYEMRPDIAREWLILVREFYGERWIEKNNLTYFENFFHPKEIMRLLDMHPDVVIEWLRLFQELGGTKWNEKVIYELLDRLLHTKNMFHIMKMRPDVAFEILTLARVLGDGRWAKKYGVEIFERFLNPREIIRMIIRHPDIAIKWLRLSREYGSESWCRGLSKYLYKEFKLSNLSSVFLKNQNAAISVIRVLRLSYSTEIDKSIKSSFSDRNLEFFPFRSFDVSSIPLDYVNDLLWYARMTNNEMLFKEIEYYKSL